MIVLGIETAGPHSSVALFSPEGPNTEIEFPSTGRLGAELAPAIRRLLREAGLGARRPPDLVAVDTGPGSYTGLRIGLAAAKGLAFAWGRPLVGIPTVEALSTLAPPNAERVLCALDASRGEVYAVMFTRREGRLQRRDFAERLNEPQRLLAELPETTLVLGDAAAGVSDPSRGILPADPPLAWPHARRIAELALRRHLRGERDDPVDLSPIYYRPNEAEEQRRKRKMRSASS